MKTRTAKATAAAVAALALLAAACGDDGEPAADPPAAPVTAPESPEDPEAEAGSEQEPSDEPVDEPVEEEPSGPPHVAEMAWGNFELADRIATKLAAGGPLNLVISVAATGEGHSAEPLEHGWRVAAAEVADSHSIEVNARVIGPNSADADAQAAAIESLMQSGDIDCLAVEASSPRLLGDVIDAAVEAGVPVFAAGGDSPDSKRFAFYGINDYAAGEAAGSLVGQWAADGGILVRRAAVLTGDAGDQRSFDLMRGFVAGLTDIHSGVEFLNGPDDVESLGFEPFAVYNATEAWVLDNIDADIVFHTDSGLEHLAQVMADHLLYGDMYAVGFHVSQPVTDYIRERLVVAAMAQGFAEQARLAGLACGDFLLAGAYETGHVVLDPVAVTRDNVDETDWTLPESQ